MKAKRARSKSSPLSAAVAGHRLRTSTWRRVNPPGSRDSRYSQAANAVSGGRDFMAALPTFFNAFQAQIVPGMLCHATSAPAGHGGGRRLVRVEINFAQDVPQECPDRA